jgi:hypothetical protein
MPFRAELAPTLSLYTGLVRTSTQERGGRWGVADRSEVAHGHEAARCGVGSLRDETHYRLEI